MALNSDFSKDVIRLFDQSPTFMAFLRGSEHRIEFVNPGYMTLVGDRMVLGRTIPEALPEVVGQGFVDMLDNVFSTGKAITANGARYDRQVNGETTALYLDFVYQPITEDGLVTGILVQGVDVTERTLAEQALIAARNAAEAAEIAKADFISRLSHNIRSPMNAVVGLADLLSKTEPLNYEQSEYLNALMMSAESVLSQVNDMVDTARIEARMVELEIAPFSPADLVRDVANGLAAQARDKGLSLSVDALCDAGQSLMGDATRIRQIVSQIASNAITFTNEGSVSLMVDTLDHAIGERMLAVSVSDTGAGMTPEKLETLFQQSVDGDAKFKRRYGGTGLGLSIAKTLAEIMGGRISVKSEPGSGSSFSLQISLPVAPEPDIDEEAQAEPAIQEQPVDNRPVLLVEDYEPNILVATTLLKRLGYSVDVAMTGMAAVEKARTGNYSLALMDVQMPGMNGMEATRKIREDETVQARRHLPIIGVTAHSLAVDRERCLDAGMDEFLPKPFYFEDLQEKITAVLSANIESV